MSVSEAVAQFEAEIERGNAHSHASEWASAISSLTRSLQSSSNQPTLLVIQLYCNRATSLYKMGSFDKAADDVRAGLALFAENEASLAAGEEGPAPPALPEKLKTHLQWMAGDLERSSMAQQAAVSTSEADLDLAVEQAAASTREVSATAQTTIPVDSPLGISLGDVRTTAYFFETQCSSLSPGSTQRFLATLWVSTCIAVFASSPDGRAFGAHINGGQLLFALEERRQRGGEGMILEEVSRAMQDTFRDVDNSLV